MFSDTVVQRQQIVCVLLLCFLNPGEHVTNQPWHSSLLHPESVPAVLETVCLTIIINTFDLACGAEPFCHPCAISN